MPSSSLALIGDLEQAGALTPIGLRLSEEMEYDRFESMLLMLGSVHQAMQWSIGDALIYGETVFGDAVYQASEVLKLSPDTLNRYRRTSERIPYTRRRIELSWSHHFLVSHLPPQDQIDWLQRAIDNNYSKHDLAGLLKEPKALGSGKKAVCPACGEEFEV